MLKGTSRDKGMWLRRSEGSDRNVAQARPQAASGDRRVLGTWKCGKSDTPGSTSQPAFARRCSSTSASILAGTFRSSRKQCERLVDAASRNFRPQFHANTAYVCANRHRARITTRPTGSLDLCDCHHFIPVPFLRLPDLFARNPRGVTSSPTTRLYPRAPVAWLLPYRVDDFIAHRHRRTRSCFPKPYIASGKRLCVNACLT